MSQTIQPIETQYAGCRFRSRLEARWAIVFDHLGLPWRYEYEGFELESGRYLPDFYLPSIRKWVEVKGAAPTDYDMRRAWEFGEFAYGRGERYALLVGDIPRPVVQLHNYIGLATGIMQIQYAHLDRDARIDDCRGDTGRPPEGIQRNRDALRGVPSSFAEAVDERSWLHLHITPEGVSSHGFIASMWFPEGPVASALRAGRSERFGK